MNEWTFYLTTDLIAVFYGDTINYGCSAATKDLVSTFDSGKSAVCERSLTLDNYLNITLVIIDVDGHSPRRQEIFTFLLPSTAAC